MSDTEFTPEPQLTGHNYDGIEEFDNPTPGWWTWLFVGTCVFSFFYFILSLTGVLSAEAAYEKESLAQTQAQFGQLGKLEPDAPTVFRLSHDENLMKIGATVFQANCVSCHGRSGEGFAGPNLTDSKYIHVRKISDIPEIVKNGRANGAMPAWGNRLTSNEIVLVASYVAGLRGQNKPGKPVEPNAIEIPQWSGGSDATK
jgi:cytochrome c oxidase cbb3-type subunit 3